MTAAASRPAALPNLIIAGVHKAGTTSLYHYLGRHPDIYPSPRKELQFFSRMANHGITLPLSELAAQFRHSRGERYRMYASPDYLCARGRIAELVRENLPEAKIIVILRDPVDRLVSMYDRAIAHSELPEGFSFDEFVDASLKWRPGDGGSYVYTRGLQDGFYVNYLRTWKAVFGDDLKVLFFDDLKASGKALTGLVCEWLGLDTACLDSHAFEVENRTLHYRNKQLHRLLTHVYMRTESFWRKHYELKNGIRTVYNRLNGGTAARDANTAAMEELRKVYAPYNAELRQFLAPQELPTWLLEP